MILSKKELGQVIKRARKLKSEEIGRLYTQKMLATELGKSQSYIGDIEAGRTYPNFILLAQIAEVCGVSISFFENDSELDDHIDRFLKNQLFDISETDLYTLKNIMKKDAILEKEAVYEKEIALDSENISENVKHLEPKTDLETEENLKNTEKYNDLYKQCVKNYIDNLLNNLAKAPENSIEFMLNQVPIINAIGLDITALDDTEKENLITDVLNQLELISYKYKK